MDENHIKFQFHLKTSLPCVLLGAKWFLTKNWIVKINPFRVAPEHEVWKAYKDKGDLYIGRQTFDEWGELSFENWQRVEIKGLSCDFTSQKDWPFGNSAIVCAKHAWDLADPKPTGFLNFNKDRTHLAIIRVSTKEHWFIEKRNDRRYSNVSQKFYLCPIEYVSFEEYSL